MATQLYNVEQAVQAYIETLLTSSTGAVGELPRAATSTTPRLWMFAMSGGPSPVGVSNAENEFAWEVNATFRGVYTSRENALDDLWALMSVLPWGSSEITEVQDVRATGPHTVFRETVELENDLDTGGELRVWAVELPLVVTFERSA